MGRKHVNDDKPAGWGGRSVSGDRDDKTPSQRSSDHNSGRERNVGAEEEHSRVPKGNQG